MTANSLCGRVQAVARHWKRIMGALDEQTQTTARPAIDPALKGRPDFVRLRSPLRGSVQWVRAFRGFSDFATLRRTSTPGY